VRRSSALLTAGVLVMGALVCAVVGAVLHGTERSTAEWAMDRRATAAQEAVEAEAARYADAVRAVAAGLGARTDPTAEEFAAMTEPLTRTRLRAATVVAYLSRTDAGQPSIVYRRVLAGSGTAAWTDAAAAHAFEAARFSGDVAASEPYRSTTGEGATRFVLVAAIPSGGWAALEVRGHEFLAAALAAPLHGILDATLRSPSAGELGALTRPGRPLELGRTMPVDVTDRRWLLGLRAHQADLPGGETGLDVLFLVAGVVVTLVVAALVFTVLTGRDRAEARVRAATAELREAERAAREHSALLTTVMESIGDGVAVVSDRGDVLMYNPTAADLFGPPLAGLDDRLPALRRPDGTPFPPEDWPLVRAVRGHASDNVEMVVPGGEGRDVCLRVSARPLTPETGQRGAVAVFHDITELRRLNDELERRVRDRTAELAAQAERLREANSELEAFSYSVSHDLRTPLRAVDGFARMLTLDHGDALDAQAHRYLERIRAGAQNMGQLIDGLLAFSRLQRLPLTRRTVDMNRLVRAVWEDLAGERGEREIPLNLDQLSPAAGDPTLIRQVWANLLSNAIKYTGGRDDARVDVTMTSDVDGKPAYAVRDNGVGFDMRYVDKLFGVFQRLHRREEYEGTGIGLALAARIVRRHGGRIWADARPGAGATFCFTLPKGAGPR